MAGVGRAVPSQPVGTERSWTPSLLIIFLFLASSCPPPQPLQTAVPIFGDACRFASRDLSFAWPGTYFVSAEGRRSLLGKPGVRVGGLFLS